MNARKTTIFRQLIYNIAIPILVVLLIFATFNFIRTRTLLVSKMDEKNRLLSDEILNIIKFQSVAEKIIEDQFYNRCKEISTLLANKYFANTSGLKKLDLRPIANEIGLDSINEDIHIISSDGVIINTTLKMELGLDLFGLGEKVKEFLQDIFKAGEFRADLFALEHSTLRPKKYTYQPTKDGKYIIELGVYSKQMEQIIQAVVKSYNEIKKNTQDVVDVELFLMADEPFSLNKNYLDVESQRRNLLKAFEDKDTLSFVEKEGKSWHQYQYFYIDWRKQVLRIITDRTNQYALLRQELVRFIFLFVITFGLLAYIIYRRSKVITLPISKLVDSVNRISTGNLEDRAEVIGNNEITILAEQFNSMVESIEFKNKMLADQKSEIESINSEITASITYAGYIQSAIFPGKDKLDLCLKKYFIIFRPRDIVSGDFYWCTKIEDKTLIAAVDCTGHGVPGAFMSILGNDLLNEIINKEYITQPDVILRRLRKEVIRSLQQRGERGEQKDGMDIALCTIDYEKKKLQFAGANNPLYIIRKSDDSILNTKIQEVHGDYYLYELKGDFMPIGIHDVMDKFTMHEIDICDGDMLYIFSDGFADQFGGQFKKKLQYRNFKKLLLEHCSKSMELQKFHLEKALKDWQGNNYQTDDILVIGIRIK